MEQFFTLTPERMLTAVERALGSTRPGVRATGRCLAMNSMENRVYQIELDDETEVVTKFYRPGRWSREAILDEHRFLAELAAAEVPVVAPLVLDGGGTIAESEDGILFAVFPKVRGRGMPELDDGQLEQAGRLLGRLHNVGASSPAPCRLQLTPLTYGRDALALLEATGAIDIQVQSRYRRVVEELLRAMEPLWSNIETFRIHGDCHLGNVLWQKEGPFFLDFDDMVIGPAVQDVWMVVRGRDAEAERQREVLLGGYQQMRRFDRSTLRLVEPLRALRFVHYSAWIARRWADPIFKRAFPEFETYQYWTEELADLEEQLRLIRALD
jgi:Ser/Thr protein kinase RdoA (MazF antagonist)